MYNWLTDERVVIESGRLNPRSPVGSLYLVDGKVVAVMSWRGEKQWMSKWLIENGEIAFDSIEGPEGIVVNWGHGKSIRRFIPSRHIDIIEDLASEIKVDWREPL